MQIVQLSILVVFLMATNLYANTEKCDEQLWTQNKITAHSFWYKSTQSCVAKVSPNFSSLRWRSYSFFEHGVFVIFNSFNKGSSVTATASRSYMLFPRIRVPRLIKEAGEVVVQAPDGKDYRFSDKDQRLKYIEGASFIDADIDPAQEGGFKLVNYNGLILDMGFQFGELGSSNPNRYSTFIDQNNQKCEQLNSIIFEYEYGYDSKGKKYLKSVHFKFTDTNLKEFLAKVCPNLEINF